ncbi:hypothetical protein ACFCV8_04880 [Streptomyces sp. NPDC056347]|uniref:hypothetical protein n=1 Tax=Streptomyces sp. NPDC056347 TaxID=3345790 RepID=UPI0035D76B77
MAESLSEDDALEAVARHIGRPGQGRQLRRTGADITPLPMLGLRVVRSVETRATRTETRPGRYDTSGLPTYEGELGDHRVEPPKDPARAHTVELMLGGSARTAACGCDAGRSPCRRCQGAGKLVCAAGTPCPACEGEESCTWCDGTGKRGGKGVVGDGAGGRTTCVKCGKPRSACPKCRGRGTDPCPRCDDTGFRECRACEGGGTTKHTPCDGTGLLTRWTVGSVGRTPQRSTARLPDPAPPLRVRQRTGRTGAWARATLTSAHTPLPEALDPVHAKAVEAALEPRPGEVARRAELEWLPLVSVAVADDPDHVFYVFPGQGGPEVLPVWSRRRSLRVAAAVAAAAVALVLLVAVLV